jgi:hypothetical protein
VLVAVDFNGTHSPFVLDTLQARAVPARPRGLAGCGCRRRRHRGFDVTLPADDLSRLVEQAPAGVAAGDRYASMATIDR